MLKNRFYLALSLVILFALLLGGCNKMPDQKEASAPQKEASAPQEEAHWYDEYSLESDEVYIYILDYELAEKPNINKATTVEGNEKLAYITITNPEDILALKNSIDFPAWEKLASPEYGYAGMEYYFIEFNKDTTIALYPDIAYGFIGNTKPTEIESIGEGIPTVRGSKKKYQGPFNMPEKLLTTVQNLVEKQLKAQAIDFKLPHQK